jgi:hypothetical protein
MCAYPAGVTSQPPIGSPAAASNPAETRLTTHKITNDELWVEFVCDGHDYFLKGVDVICVSYPGNCPWYVYVSNVN